ncbi:hypothetical protein LBMAG18_05270 [Alphaproteobacteria bacterium]|nr:hypothetical protein LBMAG18_05270 [Alphaproteobacteria bacterium]
MLKTNATINFIAKLPINHNLSDDFGFMKKYLNYQHQTPVIQNFKNTNVSNNCVIFKNFKINPDSCITSEIYQRYCQNYKFFLKYFFPQFSPAKKIIHVANEYYSNFFHWHEILQKIILLKEQNILKDSLIILPSKAKKIKFIIESLKLIGIDDKDLIFIKKKSYLRVRDLFFVNHRGLDFDLINRLRDHLRMAIKSSQINYGDKIYISRAKQKLRFVENEKKVLEILEKYNFKKVIMEDHSYQEQLSICANAKYLVAPHGAGITNIITMVKNSSVLELSSKKNEDFERDYLIMANMLEINYFYQKCQFGKNSLIFDSHHASIDVDCDMLEKNIKIMLEKKYD